MAALSPHLSRPLWAVGAAVVCASLGMVFCQRAPHIDDASVVARVDGEPISRAAWAAQVDEALARFQHGDRELPKDIARELAESVLSRMLDDLIFGAKARALGLEVTAADLDVEVARAEARFGSREALAEHLARKKESAEAFRRELGRDLTESRLAERLVGPIAVETADLHRYYEENLAHFSEPEAIRARRILWRLPADAQSGARRQLLARAERTAQAARRRPAAFAQLAHARGEGPERGADGDLGDFFPRGRRSPAFDRAAFALAPLEISAPFFGPEGVEVVQVTERRAARTRPFAEVEVGLRAALEARVRSERRREVLRQVRQAARVERTAAAWTRAPAAPGPAAPAAPLAPPAPPEAPGT